MAPVAAHAPDPRRRGSHDLARLPRSHSSELDPGLRPLRAGRRTRRPGAGHRAAVRGGARPISKMTRFPWGGKGGAQGSAPSRTLIRNVSTYDPSVADLPQPKKGLTAGAWAEEREL